MTRALAWLALTAALALGTAALGWWAVPVVAAAYGLLGGERVWLGASLAGAVAWAVLLIATAVQGPALALAGVVGAALAVPGLVFIALALVFPALLAGSAAELAAGVRRFGVEKHADRR